MPTPAERQALLFVAAVAALGVGARACRSLAPPIRETSDRTALAQQIAAVDSAVVAGGARRPGAVRRPRPTALVRTDAGELSRAVASPARPSSGDSRATEPVDVDRADAAQLDRLPGIGSALAGRIVADREQRGPFGSLRALERVKGIGPALSARLAPHVTFSFAPRPSETEVPPATHVRSP